MLVTEIECAQQHLMTHFHWRVRVGSVRKGVVQVTFPLPKSAWPGLSPTRLAVLLRWGTETPERVPGTTGKFERHTPSVDWSTESALPCDRGIITNKHSTRKVFLEDGKSLVYWRNKSYVISLCSLCALFFFIGFISRLHCVGLLWDDAHVAALATNPALP